MASNGKAGAGLFSILAVVCLIGLAVFIGWNISNNVSFKGIDGWAAVALALLGLLAVVAGIAADKDLSKSPIQWLKPGNLLRILMALMTALGLVISVYQMVSPEPATESKPGLLETLISKISTEQDRQGKVIDKIKDAVAPDEAPARKQINGVWGEEGCNVTYRFTLTGDVLSVESLKRPDGTKPYKSVASVVSAKGNELRTVDETSGNDKGRASVLTVSTAKELPKLIWKNESESVGETYVRCPE